MGTNQKGNGFYNPKKKHQKTNAKTQSAKGSASIRILRVLVIIVIIVIIIKQSGARLPLRMRIKTPCNAHAPRSYASCARAKKNKETPLASFLVSSEIF